MKIFFILLLPIVLFTNKSQSQELSFSQKKVKKAFESDTLSNRFDKGVHIFNSAPSFTLYFSNLTKEKSIFGIGAEIGYGYFPLKNWLIGTNFSYIHFFLKPKNQGSAYNLSFTTKYYFRTKKNVSFFAGLEGQLTYFSYLAKATTPNFVYYNDEIDNKRHNHLIPVIRPVVGISFKLMKNFTIQALIGYSHSFYEKEGSGLSALGKSQQYAYVFYHFNRKKKMKKLNQNIKY